MEIALIFSNPRALSLSDESGDHLAGSRVARIELVWP
jgi:hypothetical protein